MSGECQVFADAESSENPRVAILVAELDEAQQRLATILESEGHREQIAADASFAREDLAEIEAEGAADGGTEEIGAVSEGNAEQIGVPPTDYSILCALLRVPSFAAPNVLPIAARAASDSGCPALVMKAPPRLKAPPKSQPTAATSSVVPPPMAKTVPAKWIPTAKHRGLIAATTNLSDTSDSGSASSKNDS